MVDPMVEWSGSARPGSRADFAVFVSAYANWKTNNSFLDFTDMLEAYVNDPKPHGASYILIDEAQDLSDLQWTVIEAIITQPGVVQVHVAGDDDQAIFEWSGANPAGMTRFEKKYSAKREVLSQSWRLPATVHELAQRVVSTVRDRVPKEYRPRDEKGQILRHQHFSTRLIKPGVDTLILCRNFLSKSRIEAELIKASVGFTSEGGRMSPYSSKLANAIRAINKAKRGESLSQDEMNVLLYCGTTATKSLIKSNALNLVLDKGYERSLVVPPFLIEYYRGIDLDKPATVRVSTIHSAKGREADTVILDTELTQKTVLDMDVNPDAEARVWYVGVSRAKHTLHIIESDNGYPL
jgi:DNA helicase-2/ATP-dependent DNA helicase PcrA